MKKNKFSTSPHAVFYSDRVHMLFETPMPSASEAPLPLVL
jgi:hypothetical protein